MSQSELEQLELLARVDELTRGLEQWCESESSWQAQRRSRALVRRVLERLEPLRIRLEAPLVVATFGGTGTGKSALVNALVGCDCTRSGRERPTTTRPVLIAHPDCELECLGLPLEELEVVTHDAPVLRDVVLLDCPDPDTSEAETSESNLHRLRRLLPHCDVLIYTSTQQKYRSARVGEELDLATTGCRLLFVQTHADLDTDVRDDWAEQLSGDYEVPDLFFVDSLRALEEQQSGRRVTGECGRLVDVLTNRFGASQRVRIRRSNLIDLIHAALAHCVRLQDEHLPAVQRLEAVLEEQRQKLTAKMAEQLRGELQQTRNLWERRLLSASTDLWGFSPFSAMLRLYSGLGSLIASMTLFRARSSAQMALLGLVQGSRWLTQRQKDKQAEERLERLGTLTIDDASLRETQLIVTGHVQDAQFDSALVASGDLANVRNEATRVETQFLGDAGRRIDEIITQLAARKTGFLTRWSYELLFLTYVLFVLYRVGENFFYDSLILGEPVLPFDFYGTAGVLFVLWSGLLVMLFTRRLRRGMTRQIDQLADELASVRLADGLFPHLEQECRRAHEQYARLKDLSTEVESMRDNLAGASDLGSAMHPNVRGAATTE
ncbi:MAG: hypothetical protein CMJ48_14330 [Planctomycetaceae bacterium]|nr:hypothetical protein [Planctomycetaceae bacterium]